jgi:hypothetical protein
MKITSDEINSLAQLDPRDSAAYDRWLAKKEVVDELAARVAEDRAEVAAECEREPSDDMDGDFDSAMASAGHGTDEDYGYFGGGDE